MTPGGGAKHAARVQDPTKRYGEKSLENWFANKPDVATDDKYARPFTAVFEKATGRGFGLGPVGVVAGQLAGWLVLVIFLVITRRHLD